MSDPDWRKILIAYIDHIITAESIDYLDHVLVRDPEGLTPQELVCLYEAAADAQREGRKSWARERAQAVRERAGL